MRTADAFEKLGAAHDVGSVMELLRLIDRDDREETDNVVVPDEPDDSGEPFKTVLLVVFIHFSCSDRVVRFGWWHRHLSRIPQNQMHPSASHQRFLPPSVPYQAL